MTIRQTIDALREAAPDLRARAAARALETALELPRVAAELGAERVPGRRARWTSAQLRSLFPDIEIAQREAIDRGRRALRAGDLERSAQALRSARAVDPDDIDSASLLADVEASLALLSELDSLGSSTDGEPGALPLRLSADQRSRLERRLAEEQSRRDDLMGALAALTAGLEPPSESTLAALRDAPLEHPEPYGATLARERAELGRVAVLFAPRGEMLGRYYFAAGSDAAILREEDNDGDGQPDRWIAFSGGVHTDLWLDRRGLGRPDVHWSYENGSPNPSRIELDDSGDGRPDRRFVYAAGKLRESSRDRSGDGRFDVFEEFDEAGRLVTRSEDLNGDGSIDLRSHYRDGRLLRREVLDPDAASGAGSARAAPPSFAAERGALQSGVT